MGVDTSFGHTQLLATTRLPIPIMSPSEPDNDNPTNAQMRRDGCVLRTA